MPCPGGLYRMCGEFGPFSRCGGLIMSSRSAKLWLLALIMTALSACHAAGPWVEINGQRIGVEIADDNASRAKGLMFRDSLGKNSGMQNISPLARLALTDVSRFAGQKQRHAVHFRARGATRILDEEHPHSARHHLHGQPLPRGRNQR